VAGAIRLLIHHVATFMWLGPAQPGLACRQVAKLFGFQNFNPNIPGAEPSVHQQWSPATAFVAGDHIVHLLRDSRLRHYGRVLEAAPDGPASPMDVPSSGFVPTAAPLGAALFEGEQERTTPDRNTPEYCWCRDGH
jgi:hypothetical protein